MTSEERLGTVVDSEEALARWRAEATGIFLAAFAALASVALLFALMRAQMWLSRGASLFFLAVCAALTALAAARHVNARLRAVALLAIGYLVAGVALARLGLSGNGRIILTTIPFTAAILVGGRAGSVCAAVSVSVYAAFAILNHRGALERWLAAPQVAASTELWAAQGVLMLLPMLSVMILMDRYHRLLVSTVRAERQATRQVQQEMAARVAASEALERETEERRRLGREVARAGDEERQRLGRQVHDGLCQELAGAFLRCSALERRVAKQEPLRADDMAPLSSLLQDALGEAHNLAEGLCPVGLDPEGLAPALQALARRTEEVHGLDCDFDQSGDLVVTDSEQALHLYRIASEAVSNAVKHAHAAHIAVELRGDAEQTVLTVSDDGLGLPDASTQKGMGMRLMAYRAAVLAGALSFERPEGGGTRVVCRVPRPLDLSKGGTHG